MKEKAKESRQVKRAREKLKKSLEVEHQLFTTDALHEMTQKIRSMIFRKHAEEPSLKDRKITLKAETKSKKILKLQQMLKKD